MSFRKKLFLLKENKQQKLIWWFSILFSSILFLYILVNKYLIYEIDFPLAWDPPGYVGAANLILKNGPLSWMIKHKQIGLFYHLVALLGLLLKNTKFAQIILETLVALFLIFLFSKLSLAVTESYNLATITALLTPLTLNFTRIYGTSSQLSALCLMCIVIWNLDYVTKNFKIKDLRSLFLILISATVSWFHLFSFAPFLLILFLTLLFTKNMDEKKRILKFNILSFILGILPQIPFLSSFITDVIVEVNERRLPISPTWDFYSSTLIKWSGGTEVLYLVTMVGVLFLFKKLDGKKRNHTVNLGVISWIIISFGLFQLCFLFSPWWNAWHVYAYRVILILPVPLLLALGIKGFQIMLVNFFSLDKLEIKLQIKGFRFMIPKRSMSGILLVFLLVSNIIYMFPGFIDITDTILRPWHNQDTYEKIIFAKKELNKMNIKETPVFVFYKMQGISSGRLEYYRNILSMEIGEFYSYYGKLIFLRLGLATPQEYFNSEKEIILKDRLFNMMNSDEIFNHISSHPIIIITPDFYYEPIYLNQFQANYKGNGIYILPPNENKEDILIWDVITSYSKFYNPTKDYYTVPKNWSSTPRVLALYIPNKESNYSEVYFPVYLIEDYNYSIEVHLFDFPKEWTPIKFYIGDELIGTYSYSGTMEPIWIFFKTESHIRGINNLRIIIEGGERQIINLDSIFISLIR